MKSITNSIKKLSFRNSQKSCQQKQSSNENESLIDNCAKRTDYLESFPKILQYKGYQLPGDVIHSKVLDDIEDLEVRESDVFLVSYPQSGSVIVEELLVKLVDRLNEKLPSDRKRTAQMGKLEVAHPYGHLRWLNSLKRPRLLSANLPLDLMPNGVQMNPICKVIYLLRNPKDHAVSYYYYHRVKGILSSFDDFIDLYMKGHLLYGDHFEHCLQYWQLLQTYPNNVLFISYEDIKLETYGTAKQIVDFLGYDLTDADINDIILNHLTKAPKAANMYKTVDLSVDTTNTQKAASFEGVIGDWLNYFSPEQSRQMDELVRNRFEKVGLSVCCDPTDAMKRIVSFGRILMVNITATPTKQQQQPENHLKNSLRNAITSQVKKSRPKLEREEFLLLRQKSWIPIEVESIDTESQSTGSKDRRNYWLGCCCWCCPCLCPFHNYTNV